MTGISRTKISSRWRAEPSRGSDPKTSSIPEPRDCKDKKTPDDKKLDEALLDFCKSDSELRALVGNPTLYTDLRMMMAFAAHPKILLFFAARPDLKTILVKKAEKMRDLYLGTNPFMTPLGKEIGRLFGFP